MMNTLLAAAMNDQNVVRKLNFDEESGDQFYPLQGDSGVVIDDTPPTINVETSVEVSESGDNVADSKLELPPFPSLNVTDVVQSKVNDNVVTIELPSFPSLDVPVPVLDVIENVPNDVVPSGDVANSDVVKDVESDVVADSEEQQSTKDSQLSLVDASSNEEPAEELCSDNFGILSGDNFGILSDFSDPNTDSSTPLCGNHLESFLDELHACMVSVHTLDRKMIPCKRRMVRQDHPQSEDLPIILKDVVESCVPKDIFNKDSLLYSGLLALATYLESCTETRTLQAIATAEVKEWFTALFRLPEYNPSFYATESTAIVKLIYKLLLNNYPSLKEEGLFALYSKSPVIYITEYTARLHYDAILSQLLLPRSTISIIPCSTSSPHSHTIDIRALERLIDDDVACGKLPLLVLATVGTELTGHMDNIPSVRNFCDEHKIWLHASGSCVPLLCLEKRPGSLSVLSQCDSMSVQCKAVLSECRSVAMFTRQPFYMEEENSLWLYLPLWVTIQEQGSHSLRQRLQTMYDLVLECQSRVSHIENLAIVEYPLTQHVVCMKYYSTLDKLPGLAEEEPMTALMSNLTKLMCEAVEVSMLEAVTTTVRLGEELVLKYCPGHSSTVQQLDQVMSVIIEQVEKFENSLRLRILFEAEVESRDNFLLISDPEHTGIGAAQYLPKYLQDEDACSSVEGKEELNSINTKLVDYCAQLYPCIESREVGEYCAISIPLMPDELDIKGLLDHITESAASFENNSKYLERMANIIKKGIDDANKELLEEADAQFYEKGIMRNIPLFGPMLNWVSPIEDKRMIGRSFSLTSGEIHSSEAVYNSVAPSVRSSRAMSSASDSLSSVSNDPELQQLQDDNS